MDELRAADQLTGSHVARLRVIHRIGVPVAVRQAPSRKAPERAWTSSELRTQSMQDILRQTVRERRRYRDWRDMQKILQLYADNDALIDPEMILQYAECQEALRDWASALYYYNRSLENIAPERHHLILPGLVRCLSGLRGREYTRRMLRTLADDWEDGPGKQWIENYLADQGETGE